ncbi:MAG: hypothetical protein HYR56_30390 [Acidobacteria bacterium]|nr:hypothetical protein [Acidobacteriota bacterium]MBI3425974.1 hypothetical protein [Acidobacteriota bacterium]
MAKHPSTKAKTGKQAIETRPELNETITPIEAKESKPKPWLLIGLAATVAVAFLVVYTMRLDHVVGLVVDDAWYVLLAKALATGQGYTIINSPTPGIRPFYAPFFPALLSLFYRFSSGFPGNLLLLKSVSIVAMFGAGVLAYFYFRRVREVPEYTALGIAAATVLYPALVFLATSSVMSECVFTLLQLGALLLIERCVAERENKAALKFATFGALLVSAAFLTRPAGLGLLLGSLLYLLKERLTRTLLIFAAIMALLVGPWVLYSRIYAPTAEQRAEQGANIVQPYTTQFWQKVAGQPLDGTITFDDLPERVWNNLAEIGKYDIGGIAFYSLFRPLEPGERIRIGQEGRGLSLLFAALALFGYVMTVRRRVTLAEIVTPLALAISLSWGWEQFRLLLPLVPLLLYYLLMGLKGFGDLYQLLTSEPAGRRQWLPATVLIWLIVVLNLYSNNQYIQRKNDPSPAYQLKWLKAFDENEALIKYVGERVPKDAVLATQNPALVNLYTGHKTVASDDPAGAWENWKKLGVRYLVRTSPYPLEKPDASESKFNILYRQGGQLNLRVVDLGEVATRQSWK